MALMLPPLGSAVSATRHSTWTLQQRNVLPQRNSRVRTAVTSAASTTWTCCRRNPHSGDPGARSATCCRATTGAQRRTEDFGGSDVVCPRCRRDEQRNVHVNLMILTVHVEMLVELLVRRTVKDSNMHHKIGHSCCHLCLPSDKTPSPAQGGTASCSVLCGEEAITMSILRSSSPRLASTCTLQVLKHVHARLCKDDALLHRAYWQHRRCAPRRRYPRSPPSNVALLYRRNSTLRCCSALIGSAGAAHPSGTEVRLQQGQVG